MGGPNSVRASNMCGATSSRGFSRKKRGYHKHDRLKGNIIFFYYKMSKVQRHYEHHMGTKQHVEFIESKPPHY